MGLAFLTPVRWSRILAGAVIDMTYFDGLSFLDCAGADNGTPSGGKLLFFQQNDQHRVPGDSHLPGRRIECDPAAIQKHAQCRSEAEKSTEGIVEHLVGDVLRLTTDGWTSLPGSRLRRSTQPCTIQGTPAARRNGS
jgi:hypothetical protein